MINESKEEVEYLMGKFYEYRMLAAEAGANGADAEYKDFSERAMEYHERAMNQMDADAAEAERNDKMVADYEEEEANREVPRDYASMYENKNKNKMNDINLNRWAKLAGINENEGNVKGNEEWEGSINQLKKDADNPAGFAEMADIILSKYPDEGPSTYRMEVYHNNDGVVTGASGGFAIDNGNVYFNFKFKDGKVVDYSFDEQNY